MKKFLIAAFAIVAATFAQGWLLRSEQLAPRFSVRVLDDSLQPVHGVTTQTAWKQVAAVATTGSHGQTAWSRAPSSTTCELTVTDFTLPNGRLVGMTYDLDLPRLSERGEKTLLIDVTAPRAVEVHLKVDESQGLSHFVDPEPSYPHWILALPSTSTVDESIHIASLQDGEDVAAFLRYRGHELPAEQYLRGVALVLDRELELESLFVGVDTLQWIAPSDTVIDVIRISDSNDGELLATLVGSDESRIWLQLDGLADRGDIALLVREARSGAARNQLLRKRVAPLSGFAIQPDESNLDEPAEDGNYDCTVCLPGQPREVCKFPPTTQTALRHKTPEEEGTEVCDHRVTRSPRWCTAPLANLTVQRGLVTRWKTKLQLSNATEETTGGFAYGRVEASSTVNSFTNTSKPPGSCTAYFNIDLVCITPLEVEILGFPFAGTAPPQEPLYVAKTLAGACYDTTDTQGLCSRGMTPEGENPCANR